jgi:hypothetical protein
MCPAIELPDRAVFLATALLVAKGQRALRRAGRHKARFSILER